MSNRFAGSYRYSATKQQIRRAAGDHERQVRQAWVDRVLDILDSENLIDRAAAGQAADDSLLFDCNVAPLVWDDPRIAHRIRQLEASQMTVEVVDYEATIAGKTFKRAQIKVVFSA